MPKIKEKGSYVEIELEDKKIEKEINEELQDYKIDEPFEIMEAMKKQSSRFLKWGVLLNKARWIEQAIKREYEIWLSEKRPSVIKKIKEETGKKTPTIQDISDGLMAYCPNGSEKWNGKIDKAKENVEIFEIIVKATVMKKEILIATGQLASRLIDSGNLVVKKNKFTGGE